MNAQQMLEELCKEIKQMFLAVMEANPRSPEKRQRVKGCKKCRDEVAGEKCSHCFKCRQEGHLSRGCRTSPGNGQGLLRWGQQ